MDVIVCIVLLMIIAAYLMISAMCLLESTEGLAILNPCYIKKHFKSLNWFGILIVTLFFNIILLPYTPFYWFYKLMTVKKKN